MKAHHMLRRFTVQMLEATTGIEPVYAVLQSPPERAPASVSVRDSCSIRRLCGTLSTGAASTRCFHRAASVQGEAAPVPKRLEGAYESRSWTFRHAERLPRRPGTISISPVLRRL